MRASWTAVVVTSGLLLSACAAGGGNASSADKAVAGLQPTSPSDSTESNHLGGIGSTLTDMATVHGAVHASSGPCAAPNSCFGPPVANSQSGAVYQFTGLTEAQGLVSGYQQNFVDGTPVVTALGDVLKYLPPDAHATPVTPIYGSMTSCAYVNITSPTLSAQFPGQQSAAAGGFSGVAVGVELSGTNTKGFTVYDPADVQSTRVMVGSDDSSMVC